MEECGPAVVRVEAKDAHGVIKGTGFYIDPLGTIYTLAAIVEGADTVTVYCGDEPFPARVLASDPRSGVALLKAEPAKKFLTAGKSADLPLAAPIVLLGYPLDMQLSPGFGLVSGRDRRIGNLFFPTTHLRVNLPVLRGQGGSPLLDVNGRVIGIVTSSVDGGATCYALPIEAAEKVRREVVRFGEPRPGWVGVRVDNCEKMEENSRAIVCEIDPSAPAGKAGLAEGDLVLRIGNQKITNREDVLDASFFLTAGETTEIEVLRHGQRLVLYAETVLHPSRQKPALQAGMNLLGGPMP
jgi:serine protease Do